MKYIYVIGASAEVDMISSYVGTLRAEGWRITHDWCTVVKERGHANPDIPDEERARLAWVDLDIGVALAEIVWLLMPETPSIGCYAEFGAALILGKKTIVSGPRASQVRSIFTAAAQVRFNTHDEAMAALVSKARICRMRPFLGGSR